MQSADVGIRCINDPEFVNFFEKCIQEEKYEQIVDYSDFRSSFYKVMNPNTSWYEKRASLGKLLATISLISFLDLKNLDI